MCLDGQSGSTSQPGKQCYCKPGFMGPDCSVESELGEDDLDGFDPASYTKVPGQGVDFYWRALEDGKKIEGVIVGKETTSWVAVGKRLM